jgi:hypothetical protein
LRFNLTLGFADDVLKMLEDFDFFVRENIRKFRYWQIDATTITRSITSKVAGILILLAYVHAVRGVCDEVNSGISQIERNTSYLRFFSRCWNTIVVCLDDFYNNRNVYRSDILRTIAEAYDEILLACGLDLRDTGNGLYATVTDVG